MTEDGPGKSRANCDSAVHSDYRSRLSAPPSRQRITVIMRFLRSSRGVAGKAAADRAEQYSYSLGASRFGLGGRERGRRRRRREKGRLGREHPPSPPSEIIARYRREAATRWEGKVLSADFSAAEARKSDTRPLSRNFGRLIITSRRERIFRRAPTTTTINLGRGGARLYRKATRACRKRKGKRAVRPASSSDRDCRQMPAAFHGRIENSAAMAETRATCR